MVVAKAGQHFAKGRTHTSMAVVLFPPLPAIHSILKVYLLLYLFLFIPLVNFIRVKDFPVFLPQLVIIIQAGLY